MITVSFFQAKNSLPSLFKWQLWLETRTLFRVKTWLTKCYTTPIYSLFSYIHVVVLRYPEMSWWERRPGIRLKSRAFLPDKGHSRPFFFSLFSTELLMLPKILNSYFSDLVLFLILVLFIMWELWAEFVTTNDNEALKSICRLLGPRANKPTLGVQHAICLHLF